MRLHSFPTRRSSDLVLSVEELVKQPGVPVVPATAK
jgi:hypothetical protein